MIAAIAASAVLAFSSCGANKGILVKTPDLNVPFEAEMKIQAGELEVSGASLKANRRGRL